MSSVPSNPCSSGEFSSGSLWVGGVFWLSVEVGCTSEHPREEANAVKACHPESRVFEREISPLFNLGSSGRKWTELAIGWKIRGGSGRRVLENRVPAFVQYVPKKKVVWFFFFPPEKLGCLQILCVCVVSCCLQGRCSSRRKCYLAFVTWKAKGERRTGVYFIFIQIKKLNQNLIYRLFYDFAKLELLFSRYCLEIIIIRKDEKKGGGEADLTYT